MEKVIKTFHWLFKLSDTNLNEQEHNKESNKSCLYDENQKKIIINQDNEPEKVENITFLRNNDRKSRDSRDSRGSWDWFVDISPNNIIYTSEK